MNITIYRARFFVQMDHGMQKVLLFEIITKELAQNN
jgi:hypothetical protein